VEEHIKVEQAIQTEHRRQDEYPGWEPEDQGSDGDDVIAKMGLFPLLSVTRYEGRVLESQEVTKIERKPLAGDLFRIPEGYTKQKALDLE
jgi:hypothetical protein